MSKKQASFRPEEAAAPIIEFTDADEDPHIAGLISEAIISTARGEGRSFGRVVVILTGEEQLKELNSSYLDYDEPTDVLAFDLSDGGDALVEGDIYISLPRATLQAAERGETFFSEVVRLAVHGFLHLCGWDHDDDEELKSMVARGEIYVQTAVKGG